MASISDELVKLGIVIRNKDDRFNGEDTPEEVIRQVAVDRYASLSTDHTAVDAKRAELRDRLLGDREEATDAAQADTNGSDDVATRQARLRERMFR